MQRAHAGRPGTHQVPGRAQGWGLAQAQGRGRGWGQGRGWGRGRGWVRGRVLCRRGVAVVRPCRARPCSCRGRSRARQRHTSPTCAHNKGVCVSCMCCMCAACVPSWGHPSPMNAGWCRRLPWHRVQLCPHPPPPPSAPPTWSNTARRHGSARCSPGHRHKGLQAGGRGGNGQAGVGS